MTLSLWMAFAAIAVISLVVSIIAKGKSQSYALWIWLISMILMIYFIIRPIPF
jgi:hypothetical protein